MKLLFDNLVKNTQVLKLFIFKIKLIELRYLYVYQLSKNTIPVYIAKCYNIM